MDIAAEDAKRIWSEYQGVVRVLGWLRRCFRDEQCRGRPDVKSLFGFGGSLGSSCVPELEPDAQHTLRYCIGGGFEGRFPWTSLDEVPTTVAPPCTTIIQDDMLWGEGVFCAWEPSGE